jgi:hypothetical protein
LRDRLAKIHERARALGLGGASRAHSHDR